MKKLIFIMSGLISLASASAQTPADSLNRAIDSLFVRALNLNVMYADVAAPSQKALAAMGESAIPRLMEKMTTQDAREMQTLENVFKEIGHPAVAPLIGALGSKDVYQRRLSTRILGVIADTSSVMGLLGYVNDPDFRMRAGVISALGKIGDPRGLPYARGALSDRDYLVRTAAAVSLSTLRDDTVISPLIGALSDSYYGVRYSAAAALANVGEDAVAPVMLALQEPTDTLSYYLLIEVAGNLADEKFLPTLERIINSDDPYARAFAAEALGKIDSKDAMKILHKRYEIEDHPLVISKIESITLK